MAHPYSKFAQASHAKERASGRTKGYASGGAVKKSGVNINIVIPPGKGAEAPPPPLPPMPPPMAGPPGPPPGGPPMMPVKPPGMKRGGAVKAGADTGVGRLGKAKAYGGKPIKGK